MPPKKKIVIKKKTTQSMEKPKKKKKIIIVKKKKEEPKKKKLKIIKKGDLVLPKTFEDFFQNYDKYKQPHALTELLDIDLEGEESDAKLKKAHRIANKRYKEFIKTPEAKDATSYNQLAKKFRKFV